MQDVEVGEEYYRLLYCQGNDTTLTITREPQLHMLMLGGVLRRETVIQ
jgi:hypothetical protein